MTKKMMLRDAFGVDETYRVSQSDITDLRATFATIVPYVILFTARSGSTFLTHEIANSKVLSTPHEWFSWQYIADDRAKNGGSIPEYLKRLVASKKSPNGIFGIETNFLMLELFEDLIKLHQLFSQKPRWFFLRRRNLVAQAISHYIADKSKVFHSYQLNEDAIKQVSGVEYDATVLERFILNTITEEQRCITRLENMNVVAVDLYYEDIIANSKRAAMTIGNVMGAWLPAQYLKDDIRNPIKRMANSQNKEFEARFRNENAAFLEESLLKRSPILAPAVSI